MRNLCKTMIGVPAIGLGLCGALAFGHQEISSASAAPHVHGVHEVRPVAAARDCLSERCDMDCMDCCDETCVGEGCSHCYAECSDLGACLVLRIWLPLADDNDRTRMGASTSHGDPAVVAAEETLVATIGDAKVFKVGSNGQFRVEKYGNREYQVGFSAHAYDPLADRTTAHLELAEGEETLTLSLLDAPDPAGNGLRFTEITVDDASTVHILYDGTTGEVLGIQGGKGFEKALSKVDLSYVQDLLSVVADAVADYPDDDPEDVPTILGWTRGATCWAFGWLCAAPPLPGFIMRPVGVGLAGCCGFGGVIFPPAGLSCCTAGGVVLIFWLLW